MPNVVKYVWDVESVYKYEVGIKMTLNTIKENKFSKDISIKNVRKSKTKMFDR